MLAILKTTLPRGRTLLMPRLARAMPRFLSDEPREAPIRCTVFDSQGKTVLIDKQFSRKKFIKANGLHSRDLRHIDGPAALVPHILVHRGSILVNICGLRALIRKDTVMIFGSSDKEVSERLSILVYDLQTKLERHQRQQPKSLSLSLKPDVTTKDNFYEQVALEVVLIHAMTYLETEVMKHSQKVSHQMALLEDNVDHNMLQELLTRANGLRRVHRQCLAVRKALDDALDDDEDVRDMHLSSESTSDYNSIELLLETYYREGDELVQQTGRLCADVDSTEEVSNMMIDANRNQLLLFRLKMSILTVGCELAIFFAGFFGMNLENFIEETNWGMGLVVGAIAGLTVATTYANLRVLRAVKRVHMPGFAARASEHSGIRWLSVHNHGPFGRR